MVHQGPDSARITGSCRTGIFRPQLTYDGEEREPKWSPSISDKYSGPMTSRTSSVQVWRNGCLGPGKGETIRREDMTVVSSMLFIGITILSPISFQPVSPPSPTHHQVKTQKHNLTYSRQAVSAPRRYIREPTPTVPQPRNFLLLRRRGSARPTHLWHCSCQVETDSAAAYLCSRSSGMGLQPSALPANV